jgi:hypothetical protein
MAAEPMKTEFDQSAEIRDVMLKYLHTLVAQRSQNVACNRLHTTEQRFARWLLEVRDRVRSVQFNTQEFVAEIPVLRVT